MAFGISEVIDLVMQLGVSGVLIFVLLYLKGWWEKERQRSANQVDSKIDRIRELTALIIDLQKTTVTVVSEVRGAIANNTRALENNSTVLEKVNERVLEMSITARNAGNPGTDVEQYDLGVIEEKGS